MRKILIIPVTLCLLVSNTGFANEDRSAMQAQLDAACEVAREQKLAPLRQQYIDECVEKQKKDRAECERFYQNYDGRQISRNYDGRQGNRTYGGRQENRAPLFYDLPECVEAFEYRTSYRTGK